jgi:hypothetical protein
LPDDSVASKTPRADGASAVDGEASHRRVTAGLGPSDLHTDECWECHAPVTPILYATGRRREAPSTAGFSRWLMIAECSGWETYQSFNSFSIRSNLRFSFFTDRDKLHSKYTITRRKERIIVVMMISVGVTTMVTKISDRNPIASNSLATDRELMPSEESTAR